jgi:hypothetical protein
MKHQMKTQFLIVLALCLIFVFLFIGATESVAPVISSTKSPAEKVEKLALMPKQLVFFCLSICTALSTGTPVEMYDFWPEMQPFQLHEVAGLAHNG